MNYRARYFYLIMAILLLPFEAGKAEQLNLQPQQEEQLDLLPGGEKQTEHSETLTDDGQVEHEGKAKQSIQGELILQHDDATAPNDAGEDSGQPVYNEQQDTNQPAWMAGAPNTWQRFAEGYRYYKEDGQAAAGQWLNVNGRWYAFDDSGIMRTGWFYDGGRRYYLDKSNGHMLTGWQRINGLLYYMNSSGVMQTGWLNDSAKWYYLVEEGHMAVGWLMVNDRWYYFDQSGVMQTGWLSHGGKRYYLTSSGAMARGWLKLGGSWYFFCIDGVMASGGWIINNRIHIFAPNGRWMA